MSDSDKSATENGRAEARRDISSARLRFFSGGRGTWGRDLVETMRNRFALDVVIASCLGTTVSRSFEEGYNAEVVQHVDLLFGKGSFSRAYDEVQVRREQRYTKHFPPTDPA